MTTSTIICPHCGENNLAGGAFCEACGKALPASTTGGPRIISGDAIPQSAAGQKLMGDQLQKQVNRAAYTLLAVGILQLTCGAIAAAVVSKLPGSPPEMLVVLLAAQFIVGGGFLGLYFWARRAPLPASIVGLVVYCTLVALNMINSVSQLGSGNPRSGFGGLGIGWLDIVIIIFLVQGINAGMKHKRMLESGSSM
jgi:hypothetical protein